MKSLLFFLLLTPITCIAANCDLVYDEFDSLMNKQFLLEPGKYTQVASQRLSRKRYEQSQQGKFLLSVDRKDYGIAIVHTNKNTWGKFLFTWGKSGEQTVLIIKDATLYAGVLDGYRPRTYKPLRVRSSYQLDLDTGKSTTQRDADIWFHNVDGTTMYLEAVNGAALFFPLRSLCAPKNLTLVEQPERRRAASATLAINHTDININNNQNQAVPADTVVEREILADGSVLITYADGSKLKRYKGGYTKIGPDGSKQMFQFSTAAPADIPVDPPGGMEKNWLNAHNTRLLNTIEILVTDPALVESYVNDMEKDKNIYEAIVNRSRLIEFLVSP